MTLKQMARHGLFYIQEAILEVLSEKHTGLKPAEIKQGYRYSWI